MSGSLGPSLDEDFDLLKLLTEKNGLPQCRVQTRFLNLALDRIQHRKEVPHWSFFRTAEEPEPLYQHDEHGFAGTILIVGGEVPKQDVEVGLPCVYFSDHGIVAVFHCAFPFLEKPLRELIPCGFEPQRPKSANS